MTVFSAPNSCWQFSAAVFLAIVASAEAQARGQGELGKTSKGTLTISVTVAQRVVISKVRDLPGTFARSSRFPAHSFDFCVTANTATRTYGVTAFGPAYRSEFAVTDSAGERVPIIVQWTSPDPVRGSVSLSPGIRSGGHAASSGSCFAGGPPAATLVARLKTSKLRQRTLLASSAQAVFTVVISPE